MKTDDKGYSLVELLASMAILMIVGVALLGFLSHCINQYTRGSEETTLQMETQMLQNQVQDLILQTNVGIALKPVKISDSESKEGRELLLYSKDETDKPLQIRITMNYKDRTLYYQEYGLKDKKKWIEKSEKQVFASNVEDWEVKLYDKNGAQIKDTSKDKDTSEDKDTSDDTTPTPAKAKIRVKMKIDDREYEATQTVSIRNTIYSSDKKSNDVLAEE